MDPLQIQWIYASMGVIQALIAAVLWGVVFYKTGHRRGWLLLPFLPLAGVLLAPVFVAWYYTRFTGDPGRFDAMPMVLSIVIFLISIIPLVVLAIRLLNGRLRLSRSFAADVFGD